MTHTPGPWVVDAREPRVIRVKVVGTAIAFLYRVNLGDGVDDNAVLIAAAPETAAERDKLRAVNTKLLELAHATLSYCQDDSRSERRRLAMIAAARSAVNLST